MTLLEKINMFAVELHDSLRINKVAENVKPVFISGLLVALNNPYFRKEYHKNISFPSLLHRCSRAIKELLCSGYTT